MEHKKKSIAKNYLYNVSYQILVMILPIITTPYVSRVLGAENIGIYSYTLSITTFFILFGSLWSNIFKLFALSSSRTLFTNK